MKEKYQLLLPALQQIMEGLSLFNLISKIQEHKKAFKCVFCPEKDLLWEFEKVAELFRPEYSPENQFLKRTKEINTYKTFLDALELIYHDEGICLTLVQYYSINYHKFKQRFLPFASFFLLLK